MDRVPVSVLLPTVRWTSACKDVAAQLVPGDELLVICDAETDPVARRNEDLPEGVALVVAGEPSGCSGKANAIDVGAFRDELGRTVSDDGILGEHLDVTTVRRARRVEIGGTVRDTLERHARFIKLVRFHAPGLTVANTVAGTLALGLCLLFPFVMTATLTVGAGAIYVGFGQRRWTAILAYPATLTALPLLLYGLTRRTFVWGGRRYRWHNKFEVEIVE